VPAERRRLTAGFVRVHRTARMPTGTCCSGPVLLTLVPRAVADTVRQLTDVRDVRAGEVDSRAWHLSPRTGIARGAAKPSWARPASSWCTSRHVNSAVSPSWSCSASGMLSTVASPAPLSPSTPSQPPARFNEWAFLTNRAVLSKSHIGAGPAARRPDVAASRLGPARCDTELARGVLLRSRTGSGGAARRPDVTPSRLELSLINPPTVRPVRRAVW
jgi:hypothetical protein